MTKMKLILFFSYLIYLVICPYYIFNSGLPQPADVVLSIGFLVFFWNFDKKFFLIKPFAILGALLAIILMVSFGNQFYLFLNNLEGNTTYPVLFYVYNFLAFSFVWYLSKTISLQKLYDSTGVALFVTILVQFILGVFDIQNSASTWVQNGARDVLFFNNPNQLGYFVMLVLSLFILIPSTIKRYKILTIVMAIMIFYLALLSQSRVVILGVIYLIIFLLLKETYPFTKKSLTAIVLVIGAFVLFLNTNFVEDKLDSIKVRSAKRTTTLDNEVSTRGFDRIYKYPAYLLFGAGEGADHRFNPINNKELHSGFGTILFSFGILGLTLFLLFLFQIIKINFIYNLLLLFPVFLYNMVHHGFRTTMFWILLVFVLIIGNEKQHSYLKN